MSPMNSRKPRLVHHHQDGAEGNHIPNRLIEGADPSGTNTTADGQRLRIHDIRRGAVRAGRLRRAAEGRPEVRAVKAVSCGRAGAPASQPVTPSIAVAYAALDSGDVDRMREALSALLHGIETAQMPALDGFTEIVSIVASGAYAKGVKDAQAVA